MIWQDIALSFIAGWLSCRVWRASLAAYRKGHSLKDAINPHRREREQSRVPRVTEVVS